MTTYAVVFKSTIAEPVIVKRTPSLRGAALECGRRNRRLPEGSSHTRVLMGHNVEVLKDDGATEPLTEGDYWTVRDIEQDAN